MGWDIYRLPHQTIPIDIGLLKKNKKYFQIVEDRLLNSTKSELIGLSSSHDSNNIRDVATFLDNDVDKQKVFELLQTRFRWDPK